VLHEERIQDQESLAARDRGTEIHKALEAYFNDEQVPLELQPWVMPAAAAIAARGQRVASEKVLVGDGYAGRTDLIQEAKDCWLIWDFKTTKKLPEKGSWNEHVLQLAAYAAAFWKEVGVISSGKPIRTANAYISTTETGKFVIWDNDPDWAKAYQQAFQPLVSVWQFLAQYKPVQP
jgi:hypothetical protein